MSDSMDMEDMDDAGTDPGTQIIIHEVEDSPSSNEYARTVYDGGAGDHYTVAVE